jgi:predicted TIM-barrel fold metal-dependent hydrolase
MGKCEIDHTVEDVRKKLEEQSTYMPMKIVQKVQQVLEMKLEQEALNEVFHLLKKYDLATAEEKQERNNKLEEFVYSLTM